MQGGARGCIQGDQVARSATLEDQTPTGTQQPAAIPEGIHIANPGPRGLLLPYQSLGDGIPGAQESGNGGVRLACSELFEGREGFCQCTVQAPFPRGSENILGMAVEAAFLIFEGLLGQGPDGTCFFHRDINQPGIGAVGHGLPVVGPLGSGENQLGVVEVFSL